MWAHLPLSPAALYLDHTRGILPLPSIPARDWARVGGGSGLGMLLWDKEVVVPWAGRRHGGGFSSTLIWVLSLTLHRGCHLGLLISHGLGQQASGKGISQPPARPRIFTLHLAPQSL